MNLQQLQYVLAIDEHRHFQKAAEACFVTPATLSIMLKRLESELGITIFDRSKQPVLPTNMGEIVIRHARNILSNVTAMQQEIKFSANDKAISGALRIGVIPTVAPYLLHLFVSKLLAQYPNLSVQIKEMRTEVILEQLRKGTIDVGILALMDNWEEFKFRKLFDERLLVFVSESEPKLNHQYLATTEIDVERLWLLEEDHCLRSQVMHLCSLKKKAKEQTRLQFDAGSIESLMNIVEANNGITVIPELALINLSAQRKRQVCNFAQPEPLREIGMLTYRHFVKENLLDILEQNIQQAVQPWLKLPIVGKKEKKKKRTVYK